MKLSQVIIETNCQIKVHHMDLLKIGMKHGCPMDPGAEYEINNISHYLIPPLSDRNPKETGDKLVQSLLQLEYIIRAEYISPKDTN